MRPLQVVDGHLLLQAIGEVNTTWHLHRLRVLAWRRLAWRTRRRAGLTILMAMLAVGISTPVTGEEASSVHFGLHLEYEHFSYLADRGGQLVDSRNALTAIPKIDWAPTDSVLLHFSTLLRQDFSEDSRSQVYPYDAFLSIDREGWSLKVGRQFISWGRADGFRPTDEFKRHDFTDLIENREEAIDAAKLDLAWGSWTLESVWAPVFRPDVISYRPENRWNGLPTATDVPTFGLVNLSFRTAPSQPAQTLGTGQVGMRLSGSAQGWDFAGMYYYGYDRVPTFTRRELARFDPLSQTAKITLVPVHKRIQVFGGDVATTFSGFGLRAEAAYTLTSPLGPGVSGTNDPYFRFTGGVDRTFTRLPIGESVLVIVQYAVDTAPQPPIQSLQTEVDPRLHFFQHAMVVNTTWKYTEFVRLGMKTYVNLLQGDYVLQPELAWRPLDPITVVVGGDVLGGRPATFFGQFRENGRIRFRVSYDF